nr:putative ribonuclease H-like domain-containing protein [Tanacetum cinerariifolium]
MSSQDDGFQPSSDDGKKVDEDSKQESECKDQEKEDNVNSTNNVNAAGTNKVNIVGAHINNELPFDLEMNALEDISTFNFLSDHEDDDEIADLNYLDTTIHVGPTQTTRIYKDHPLDQVIGDLHSTTQTRNVSKNLEEHGFVTTIHQRTNHKDLENYLFACFLSQEEPKKDERGIVIRNKERLVGQRHTQEEGIDYDEFFSHVARIKVIRLFLAYASFKDFMVYQMDVKSAFLYEKIEEEVYVCQPLGFKDPDFPDKVYKVEKALYGLHQAPRAWYETLLTYLLDNGFHRGKIDKTLFIRRHKDDILLVQVYVDDVIFVCACARYQVNLKVSHLHVVKRIFSDYAGASLDRKSITGGCQFLGCRFILWQCKKQTMVANSTTKVEYVAALSWVRKDFSGRDTPLFPTMMVQAQENMGEGSANPTDPHQPPTIIQAFSSQPQKTKQHRKSRRKVTEVPQPSNLTKHVADEAANEDMDDNLKRATTTATSLDAEHAVEATDDSPAVPEHTTVETPTNMSPENKAHFLAEKETIHLTLTRIGDDIYSTVDTCQTAHEMWEAIERLQQGESLNIQDVETNLFWEFGKFTSHDEESMESYYTRFYKLMNEMIRNNLTMTTMHNLALIAKYFKKIYKPTTNNLRISSNSKNKNVDITPRHKNDDHSGQFGTQRTVNVAAARETIGSKPKRVKDSAYHKEKMLLCKQAEQGVPLQAKQYDWLADTDEEVDEQEPEAHYNYMAKIQEAPTTDSGTDLEPVKQVQNDAGYNVFANGLQHSEQSESVSNTCLVETDDSNVTPDSPYMCEDDILNEQNDVESDDERVALANLIANLKLDVDENKKIEKQSKKANTTLAQELKECKTILAETSKSLGKSISV